MVGPVTAFYVGRQANGFLYRLIHNVQVHDYPCYKCDRGDIWPGDAPNPTHVYFLYRQREETGRHWLAVQAGINEEQFQTNSRPRFRTTTSPQVIAMEQSMLWHAYDDANNVRFDGEQHHAISRQ